MKKKEITMEDLMFTYEMESFHECFGIPNPRGLEIIKQVEETLMIVHKDPTWSPAKLLKRLTDAKVAQNFRETALVVFLVGCHVGEDSVYQGLITQTMMKMQLGKKKGDEYVN